MAKWRYRSKYHRRNISFYQQCIEAVVVWTTAAFLYARNDFTIPPAGRFRPFPRSPPHLISVVQKTEIRMEVPSMGFNYRQKRKEFEQNWAKALKQYIAAGMTQEQITAMRELMRNCSAKSGSTKTESMWAYQTSTSCDSAWRKFISKTSPTTWTQPWRICSPALPSESRSRIGKSFSWPVSASHRTKSP